LKNTTSMVLQYCIVKNVGEFDNMTGWTILNIVTKNMDEERIQEVKNLLKEESRFWGDDGWIMEDTGDCIPIFIRGYGQDERARRYARDFLCKDGEKAVIVNANDTTDAGEGLYLEYIGGELKLIDAFYGIEGAW